MNISRIHKVLGLIMLVPLVAWSATGAVFLIKPGYQGAYEMISPRFYPLEQRIPIYPRNDWLEARVVRTVLGYHLLVKTADNTLHLDPVSQMERPHGTPEQIEQLLRDAISVNPSRYGDLLAQEGSTYSTSTGVSLSLDWNNLRISQ